MQVYIETLIKHISSRYGCSTQISMYKSFIYEIIKCTRVLMQDLMKFLSMMGEFMWLIMRQLLLFSFSGFLWGFLSTCLSYFFINRIRFLMIKATSITCLFKTITWNLSKSLSFALVAWLASFCAHLLAFHFSMSLLLSIIFLFP